jgi:hypothetical protein
MIAESFAPHEGAFGCISRGVHAILATVHHLIEVLTPKRACVVGARVRLSQFYSPYRCASVIQSTVQAGGHQRSEKLVIFNCHKERASEWIAVRRHWRKTWGICHCR